MNQTGQKLLIRIRILIIGLMDLMQYKKRVGKEIEKFNKHSLYLKPGRYLAHENFRYIYRKDENTEKMLNNIILKNSLIRKKGGSPAIFIKKLLIPSIKVKNTENNQGFDGTIYLPSNDIADEKDVKILNFQTAEILTIYSDLKRLKKKIDDYEFFSPYFLIPEILSYDFARQTSVEEMVICKPKGAWINSDCEKVVEHIFEIYIDYYEKFYNPGIVSYESIENILEELKGDSIVHETICFLEKKIPKELKTCVFPFVKQHGDLWLYNILIEKGNKNDIYFIDWEHSGEYVFFYDLFWWMQNEALYNNNYSYLGKYSAGFYDCFFEKIFGHFKVVYIKDMRKVYFYIFLVELLYKRVFPQGIQVRKAAKRLYVPLIEKVQNM